LFPTVEAIVGNSQWVHAGTIRKLVADPEKLPYNRSRYHLVVHVDETLKGPSQDELRFDIVTGLHEIVSDLHKKAVPMLWISPPKEPSMLDCLRSKMEIEQDGSSPEFLWFRLHVPGVTDRHTDLDEKVFGMDFRVISSWDKFLALARAFAKKHPKVVDLLHFAMPNNVSLMCGDYNAYGLLSVPKVAAFKTVAQEMMSDPRRLIAEAKRNSQELYKNKWVTEQDLAALRERGAWLLEKLRQPADGAFTDSTPTAFEAALLVPHGKPRAE